MELKLFESLLDDLKTVNEDGARNIMQDRMLDRGHGMTASDFDDNQRSHDDVESHADAIKVYGDNSLVITFEAHLKVYNGKEESSLGGVDSMNVKAFISNGKVLFSAEAQTLPAVELYKWNGDPSDLEGLIDGAESSIEEIKEEGHKDIVEAYANLLATHPKLWNDVAVALTNEFKRLNAAD